MTGADLIEILNFQRARTLATLDAIAKEPEPEKILGWRPAPGRAHAAWQLMHIAATDDRHLNVRVKVGQPADAELVRRFAVGSTPDDDIPTVDQIRSALAVHREKIVEALRSMAPDRIDTKPSETMPWTYREWILTLAWHEAHHQGQAHLTINMFKNKSG